MPPNLLHIYRNKRKEKLINKRSNEQMEKTYKVFTLKLADKLRKQGFRIVDV